jgi:hypothetical protein
MHHDVRNQPLGLNNAGLALLFLYIYDKSENELLLYDTLCQNKLKLSILTVQIFREGQVGKW